MSNTVSPRMVLMSVVVQAIISVYSHRHLACIPSTADSTRRVSFPGVAKLRIVSFIGLTCVRIPARLPCQYQRLVAVPRTSACNADSTNRAVLFTVA